MRTVGWIILVIGVLSCLGASLKGHSVFGPLFWIGLGLFLIHKANTKAADTENATCESRDIPKDSFQKHDSARKAKETVLTAKSTSNTQMESLEDIQSQLTLQQREAAMCLISYFGGYNNNLMDEAPIMLFKQSAVFFGIPDSPSVLSKIMTKYNDADTLLDIVLTIKPVKAKEFLLLTCYDLIKSTNASEAHHLLLNIAKDMGYDQANFTKLIKLYQ